MEGPTKTKQLQPFIYTTNIEPKSKELGALFCFSTNLEYLPNHTTNLTLVKAKILTL